MPVALILGLTLQAVALTLVFVRLGRRWVRHLGAVFIVLAVFYHGVNEAILWVFPGLDPYRLLVTPDQVDAFVLWVSVAILLFAGVYLLALRRSAPILDATLQQGREEIVRFFDWRVMLLVALPLMAVILAGRNSFTSNGDLLSTNAAVGISLQFFLIALVLASLGFVVRHGNRWLMPALAIQSVLVAAIAQRALIVSAAGLLLYGLAQCGIRPRRRQLILGGVGAVLLTLVITSARAVDGHLPTTAGNQLRIQYLVDGLGNIGSASTWHQLAADFGYRFDGNSFGAMELASLERGAKPLGITPLTNDVLLAVPSFLNPKKVNNDIGVLVEKIYAEEHLALTGLEVAPGAWLDILPTQLGVITGYWGPWGMLFAALMLGYLFARVDRWLLRSVGPARMLIGLGLLTCVLNYEGSWDEYTTSFRGILVLLVIVVLLKALKSPFGRRTHSAHLPSLPVSEHPSSQSVLTSGS